MARLTGSEAKGLMEAYAAVYAPQELTEEQVWEEVEDWVNSLVEEGYDLSEYTWEEMYEEYLNEKIDYSKPLEPQLAAARDRLRAAQTTRNAPATPQPQMRGLSVGQGGFRVNNRPVQPGMSPIFQRPGQPAPAAQSPASSRPATPAATPPAARPAARPAAATPPAARPSAAPPAAKTAPAAPAKPAVGKLGNTAFERRTPTSAELRAAQRERATQKASGQDTSSVKNAEKALQAAKAAGTSEKIQAAGQAAGAKAFSSPTAGASAFKPATVAAAPSTSPSASGSVAPATAAIASTPKPTPVAPKAAAPAGGYSTREGDGKPRKKEDILFSYQYEDAYDLVLEYLFDNGHVDTVDEAHYVMLEMDSETIADIVGEVLDEAMSSYDRNRKRAAQRAAARNAARDAGKTGAVPGVGYVTPRREKETYRDSAGVERHTSGARMPQKDK